MNTARARRNARRRARRRTSLRREQLWERYRITPEQRAAMFIAQGEACAICADFTDLVVDHDHDSGRVRGLLCRGCNLGLGHFLDSAARLRSAAEYLDRHAA